MQGGATERVEFAPGERRVVTFPIALDAGAVRIALPKDLTPRKLVGFVNKILALEVKVDQPAVARAHQAARDPRAARRHVIQVQDWERARTDQLRRRQAAAAIA